MIDLAALADELKIKIPKFKTVEEIRRAREIYNNIVRDECEKSLEQFIRSSWHIIEPGTTLEWNWHLTVMCAYLEKAYYDPNFNRLIINVPPGSMKSSIVSVGYPVWVWVKSPVHKFLGIANEQGLALRDAAKAKLIIEDDWFQNKWPLAFSKNQNEKMLYLNEFRGYRQSLGITGKITGKRGDTLLIDDPHDATQVESELQRQSILDIYDTKISTRLNHPKISTIILIMQRLNQLDLTGHLIKKKKTKWVQLVIPMEYDGVRYNPGRDIGRPDLADPRKNDGELFFPRRFDVDSVAGLKEDLSEYGVAGQLQQRPSPKGGGILKRHWWKLWSDDKKLPRCEHVFASWDTAYSERDLKSNSYSAMTLWGVFWHEQKQKWALLLLRAWDGQVDYPDLREHANLIEKEDQPDCQLIEKKASGQSLVQDLRRSGVMVRTYNPDRDKIARAYSVQAMLKSGLIYAPNRRWADKVIDMLAVFPNGASPSSDYTDTCTQAWIYLREGLWIEHPDDDQYGDNDEKSEKRGSAYG